MQTRNDIGSIVIGGTNVIAIISDVQAQMEVEIDEIVSPTRFRQAGQVVKIAGMRITTPLKSIASGTDRLSHMHLTALSIGGQNLIPEYTDVTFRVNNTVNPVPNGGEMFRRYQCDPGGSIEVDANGEVADAGSAFLALLALIESGVPANYAAAFQMTLNGEAFNIPGLLRSSNHTADGRQKVSVGWQGNDPGGVAFPTAPTTSVTLLGKALNAPKTPLAFTYVSHATEGLSRSGNLLIESAEVRMENDKTFSEQYAFRSTGPLTSVLN